MSQDQARVKQGYLSVRDFEKLQHYHDRALVWIKLHVALLDDYQFQRLPDDAKFHFVGLMLLAARMGNRLPHDPTFLARQIGANSEIQLSVLIEEGFLIPAKRLKANNRAASRLLAAAEQPASPDKIRKEKNRLREKEIKKDLESEKNKEQTAPLETRSAPVFQVFSSRCSLADTTAYTDYKVSKGLVSAEQREEHITQLRRTGEDDEFIKYHSQRMVVAR